MSERTKEEIDEAIARMDNLVALSAQTQEDRNAWLMLRIKLRERPKRPSERMIAPMAMASMHISESMKHANKALEFVGDMQVATRQEVEDLFPPPPARDDEG